MDLLTNKFKDYFDFDNNDNFDQIIEMIATEFHQQNQLKDKSPSGRIYFITERESIGFEL
jgi:hypothetical protein